MKAIAICLAATCTFLCFAINLRAQQPRREYRLNSVDLKNPVIWGAACNQPPGSGLSFGGQDQDADDGRPHTRVLVDGEWTAIDRQLRKANPLQASQKRAWELRNSAKQTLSRARFLFFQGLSADEEIDRLNRDVHPTLSRLAKDIAMFEVELPKQASDAYVQSQLTFAKKHLQSAQSRVKPFAGNVSAESLKRLHQAQIDLEFVADALDAEPPPRAMNCGGARLSNRETGPDGNTLVYDSKTKLYVLIGGDHLDYLTNDTWVFDPAKRRWFQRHPEGAPPPRANHRLKAAGDGKIRMTGGFTYTSNTGYISGQYADIGDGPWTYDLEKNQWSGGPLVPPNERVYRAGALHPDFYFQGPKPDAAKFGKWLRELPANKWTATNPPHRPRLNRDWGTARIDPNRDMILRWSGGHSAHGGTDVLHYHFSTNRWELPIPVEFPLGQLYSNTSYPNGFNFNLRPWITGHTYQNYDYDPPSKMMIKAGRPRHYYVYDPEVGDWVGRGKKPAAMQYNSCFYDLTLAATPQGVVCWGKQGSVHRYDHAMGKWNEMELTGEKLAGSYVDNSSMVYDSKRDRLLMLNTHGFRKPFGGKIWSLDLKTNRVATLSPAGHEHAFRFANVDKSCYDAAHDLLLVGTYLKDGGDHTRTPAYDCANDRWVTLNLKYSTGKRYGRTTRAFPHGRSDGLVFDSRRKIFWGTDTNSHAYVLRLDPAQAGMKPLR